MPNVFLLRRLCLGVAGLLAAGLCRKRGGWIVSVYRGNRDPYKTVKVKKTKNPAKARA